MCGIAGIYSKSPAIGERLGAHLGRMLGQLSDRGPDSAGIAIYREPVAGDGCKLSLHAPDGGADWERIAAALDDPLGVVSRRVLTPDHCVLAVDADAGAASAQVAREHPSLQVMSAGRSIEIYKEATRAEALVERYGVHAMAGTHALGHTRMATESRVTTAGSHPFSSGLDLCLVHNGSLSNHNRLRRMLQREGIAFQTENDTEVAAGYLTWRMREGATLEEALESCLTELDGFYTFAVGTEGGFAVLRDPIACKPAVMAETDEWVAIASEYRALDVLPGAADAEVWEPAPAVVYSWGAVTV